jgi:chromosomal replication initiation ATPase DnaA
MINDIIETACAVFDLPRAALTGPSRAQHIVEARQAVMLALRRRTSLSLAEIGKLFDGRDHSTVTYSIVQAERRCERNSDYRAQVNVLLDVPGAHGRSGHPARRASLPLRWALATYGGVPTAKAA